MADRDAGPAGPRRSGPLGVVALVVLAVASLFLVVAALTALVPGSSLLGAQGSPVVVVVWGPPLLLLGLVVTAGAWLLRRARRTVPATVVAAVATVATLALAGAVGAVVAATLGGGGSVDPLRAVALPGPPAAEPDAHPIYLTTPEGEDLHLSVLRPRANHPGAGLRVGARRRVAHRLRARPHPGPPASRRRGLARRLRRVHAHPPRAPDLGRRGPPGRLRALPRRRARRGAGWRRPPARDRRRLGGRPARPVGGLRRRGRHADRGVRVAGARAGPARDRHPLSGGGPRRHLPPRAGRAGVRRRLHGRHAPAGARALPGGLRRRRARGRPGRRPARPC